MTDTETLAAANELLRAHALAAVRLKAWDGSDCTACLEVFHIEWEGLVFGELRFRSVSYLQLPSHTQWGYRIRISPEAVLASRGDLDADDIVYELYAEDGAEPSAFIVAEGLVVQRAPAATPLA